MTLPTSVTKGLTFALGLGFAFLPAYGPFVGLLLLVVSRWSLRRADLLWWGAAFFLALPLGVHSGVRGFVFGAAQVLAPWLVYRAFAALHTWRVKLEGVWIGVGLLTGLALIVALGVSRALGGAEALSWPEPLHTGPQGSLYGHMVLTLGALVAVLLPHLRWQLLSLTLSALGVLVSGSREAALAWLIVAVALGVVGKTRAPGKRFVTGVSILTILAGGALLGPLFGWGNAGFLIDVAPAPVENTNLLQGTEVVTGDWWRAVGVTVTGDRTLDFTGAPLRSYLVAKVRPGADARLQQVVSLDRGEPYTLSLWLWAEERANKPGVQLRGRPEGQPGDEGAFVLEGALTGGWQAAVSGPGRVLDAGTLETKGLWRRVYATFVYEGDAPKLGGTLGFAPDQREQAGSQAAFAGFQLERGLSPSPYEPGAVTQGLSLQRSRVALWQSAWSGFTASPLWGQGETFTDFFRRQQPDQQTPSHAHSLPLQVLFERGLFGAVGLLLFLVALGYVAVQKGDAAFLAVLVALLAANLFDVTLFSGQVLYPVAAVAGWRASAYRYARAGERDSAMRQLGVQVALMLTDFVMVLLAFNLAVWTRQVSAAWLGLPPIDPLADSLAVARYALLLWPVMAWREGLYPGYGLTEPQELRKQIVSAAYAGLILAVGTVLFTRELTIPRSVLLLTIAFSMVFAPFGRALIKRFLWRLRLWGRAVVILGRDRRARELPGRSTEARSTAFTLSPFSTTIPLNRDS